MNKTDFSRIIRDIERLAANGEALPVSAAWKNERVILDKNSFFKAARTAKYNVKKIKGEWYEQTL